MRWDGDEEQMSLVVRNRERVRAVFMKRLIYYKHTVNSMINILLKFSFHLFKLNRVTNATKLIRDYGFSFNPPVLLTALIYIFFDFRPILMQCAVEVMTRANNTLQMVTNPYDANC